MRLTVKRIERLTTGRHAAGGVPGLYLRVAPGGSRQWILRVVVKGRRQDIGLGGYPTVTITEARDRAYELRSLARRGGDPRALVQSAHVPSFGEAVAAMVETHGKQWRESTARQVVPTLERYAGSLWSRTVDSIGRADVIDALKGASGSVREKLRIRLAQTFDWATAYGYIESSPVPPNGVLKAVGAESRRTRSHHAALDWRKMPEYFAALPQTTAGRCMEFLILTCTRSAEARGARWSEIDHEAATWTIPQSRMKSKREHRIPLSTAAVAVLDAMPKRGPFVFAGRSTGHISDEGLRGTVKAHKVTVHGMRTAARMWMQETGEPRDVSEAALAHVVAENQAEAAYARSDLFDARRGLMDRWAAFVLTGK